MTVQDCFECHCLRERIWKLEQEMARTMEQQYKWASIINQLAVIATAEEVSVNDRDYVQDAIDMVVSYLGLAE